jgi:CheY-like chemotaxis protein
VPFRSHPTCDQEDEQSDPSSLESAMDIVYLQFAVEDTGRGLSPEEMGALFQRFSQASPKTYGKYGYVISYTSSGKADNNLSGSGLGLFISRELIELQGGQIGVHSVQGQGTTFFCYIKAQRYRPRPERPDGHRRLSSEFDISQEFKRHKSDVHLLGEDSPPATPNSQGMSVFSTMPTPLEQSPAPKELGVIHVLVVEDNKINQKVLSQQLKRHGCITHTADHGGQALEFLLRSTFAIPQEFFHNTEGYTECSVILLDIEMPGKL